MHSHMCFEHCNDGCGVACLCICLTDFAHKMVHLFCMSPTHYSYQCHCAPQYSLCSCTFAGQKTPAESSHTPAYTIGIYGVREASFAVHFNVIQFSSVQFTHLPFETTRRCESYRTACEALRSAVMSVLSPPPT